jgi:cytochrome P450
MGYALMIGILSVSLTSFAASHDVPGICPYEAIHKPAVPDPSQMRLTTFQWLLQGIRSYIGSGLELMLSDLNPSIPSVKLTVDSDVFSGMSQMSATGPEVYFYGLAQRAEGPLVKVQIANQWIYIVKDSELAQNLLTQQKNNLGRGSFLEPFRQMVGNVFFTFDGPEVKRGRGIFLNSVKRKINFSKLSDTAGSVIQELKEKNEDFDLYASVMRYVIGSIGRTFVGIQDLDSFPDDAYLTYLEAAQQIIAASTHPLSRLFGPSIRVDFKVATERMALLSQTIIEENIDSICQGENYTWDLAIARAQSLYPENNFSTLESYSENDSLNSTVRELILNDPWVRQHGPMTMFASLNVGRTLFYLLDVLRQRPDLVEGIQKELREIIGVENFEVKHLKKLNYLHAVVNEALFQLTPIATFPREVLNDFVVTLKDGDVSFTRGNVVILPFQMLQGEHREFAPEPWLVETDCPNLWVFGKGNRKCPAEPYAKQLIEQFIVIMFLEGVQIMPIGPVDYTTRLGGVSPDYQQGQPILGKVLPMNLGSG